MTAKDLLDQLTKIDIEDGNIKRLQSQFRTELKRLEDEETLLRSILAAPPGSAGAASPSTAAAVGHAASSPTAGVNRRGRRV